jgi:hypothetical protein
MRTSQALLSARRSAERYATAKLVSDWRACHANAPQAEDVRDAVQRTGSASGRADPRHGESLRKFAVTRRRFAKGIAGNTFTITASSLGRAEPKSMPGSRSADMSNRDQGGHAVFYVVHDAGLGVCVDGQRFDREERT